MIHVHIHTFAVWSLYLFMTCTSTQEAHSSNMEWLWANKSKSCVAHFLRIIAFPKVNRNKVLWFWHSSFPKKWQCSSLEGSKAQFTPIQLYMENMTKGMTLTLSMWEYNILSFLYICLQWKNYTTQNTTMECRNLK